MPSTLFYTLESVLYCVPYLVHILAVFLVSWNINKVRASFSIQSPRKRLGSPGIDSEESIPLVYVAWRAGTTNRVVVPAHNTGNRFLGSLEGLKIWALIPTVIYSILYITLRILLSQNLDLFISTFFLATHRCMSLFSFFETALSTLQRHNIKNSK